MEIVRTQCCLSLQTSTKVRIKIDAKTEALLFALLICFIGNVTNTMPYANSHFAKRTELSANSVNTFPSVPAHFKIICFVGSYYEIRKIRTFGKLDALMSQTFTTFLIG